MSSYNVTIKSLSYPFTNLLMKKYPQKMILPQFIP